MFIFSPKRLFDLITAVPLFIEMVFIAIGNKANAPLQYIRLLKVFRILELYRFGEANLSVRVAVVALYRSMRQISAALISLIVLLVTSSSFMFLVENHYYDVEEFVWYRLIDGDLVKSPFQSVPQTFYWAMVTLTTTGYGDQYPVTELGRLVAGITMMFGVAVIALPTSIIGTNLTYEWNKTLGIISNSPSTLEKVSDPQISSFTDSPYSDSLDSSSVSYTPQVFADSSLQKSNSYDNLASSNIHSPSNKSELSSSKGQVSLPCPNCASVSSELAEIKHLLNQLLNKNKD
ncbi:Potassium voltage-gated channel subfamily B member 2 [Smittium mucronatum]|uniref:Potassium voltage-gated channel subfamily B member 2 n=1 Tax=Smittium mucronatum TaxID=133383 RepID=A0A1R0GYY8_9FUNG|nr:Potassium voltage-gated channel subfamily B member 2 [Smittium mucronatum]